MARSLIEKAILMGAFAVSMLGITQSHAQQAAPAEPNATFKTAKTDSIQAAEKKADKNVSPMVAKYPELANYDSTLKANGMQVVGEPIPGEDADHRPLFKIQSTKFVNGTRVNMTEVVSVGIEDGESYTDIDETQADISNANGSTHVAMITSKDRNGNYGPVQGFAATNTVENKTMSGRLNGYPSIDGFRDQLLNNPSKMQIELHKGCEKEAKLNPLSAFDFTRGADGNGTFRARTTASPSLGMRG